MTKPVNDLVRERNHHMNAEYESSKKLEGVQA